jgi:hypothetical protein
MRLKQPQHVYGPNHALVSRFILRLEELEMEEWVEAATAVGAVDERDWCAALRALHDAARRRKLMPSVERAAVDAIGVAQPAARELGTTRIGGALVVPSMHAAVAAAASALAVRGWFPAIAAAALYFPWADLIPLYEIDPA